MYFEIYRDGLAAGGLLGMSEWRWRLKASNHEPIASGEGYKNKQDCLHAIELLKSTNAATPIKEV